MEDRRILIDTSVVIDHFRKKNKQLSLLYELSKGNRLFLSAISKFEFLVGTKLSQIRQTEKIINGFNILSFNSKDANNFIKSGAIHYCIQYPVPVPNIFANRLHK